MHFPIDLVFIRFLPLDEANASGVAIVVVSRSDRPEWAETKVGSISNAKPIRDGLNVSMES